MVAESTESMIDQRFQLLGSTDDGVAQGFSLMTDDEGLMTRQMCVHHAALVVFSTLAAILVAEIHLNPCDVFADKSQCMLKRGVHLGGHVCAILNGMVRIH